MDVFCRALGPGERAGESDRTRADKFLARARYELGDPSLCFNANRVFTVEHSRQWQRLRAFDWAAEGLTLCSAASAAATAASSSYVEFELTPGGLETLCELATEADKALDEARARSQEHFLRFLHQGFSAEAEA